MHGLLYYDRGAGEGEFYSTDANGGIFRTRLHIGWRPSWTQIIPGQFGGNSFTDLLFYDAVARTGEFYTTDGLGRISLLKRHTHWRSSWTHIIPGQFGGSGLTDLLFYDAAARTGEFYTTNGQGGIALLRQHTNWRSSWTHIIPGHFGGNSFTDLLFYDAAARTGEFYTTNQGGITLLRQHTGWRSTWTKIIPGQFGGSSFTDLLFYDAAAGTGAFYSTNGQGAITLLREHTGWRSTWTHIVPGDFGGNSWTDLLFYDAAARTGEFYTTNGQGGITLLRQHSGWRSSWAQIIPGQFSQTSVCLRVHFKSLLPITPTITAFFDAQFAAMFQLFARSGITSVRLTTEDLSGNADLVPLQNLDVGACRRGQTTAEQHALFANRNNVGSNELVVYLVSTLIGGNGNFVGCAAHPTGSPGAAIMQVGAQWLMAHEVGHVLGLRHVCGAVPTMMNPNPPNACIPGQSDSLMFPNTGWTNVPPNLSSGEESTMRNSGLTNPC
jgi:hypothetical protein